MTPLTTALLVTLLTPVHDPKGPEPKSTDTIGLWTQWRGPSRDGHSLGEAWASDLSPANLVEVWRVDELGPSYSGPVVDAERVYTTETIDEEYEVVRAISRATGEELWQTSWQ